LRLDALLADLAVQAVTVLRQPLQVETFLPQLDRGS
jgi:hypothetical protein